MALIKDRKPKQSTGGYERLFNDEQLGALLARVQSTVIANGYELEKILAGKFNSISNLDQFIENYNNVSPLDLYDELDKKICALFHLSIEEQNIIKNAIDNENKFI